MRGCENLVRVQVLKCVIVLRHFAFRSVFSRQKHDVEVSSRKSVERQEASWRAYRCRRACLGKQIKQVKGICFKIFVKPQSWGKKKMVSNDKHRCEDNIEMHVGDRDALSCLNWIGLDEGKGRIEWFCENCFEFRALWTSEFMAYISCDTVEVLEFNC